MFECHEEKDVASVKGHEGQLQKSCVDCHDPHMGVDKFLLKAAAKGGGRSEGHSQRGRQLAAGGWKSGLALAVMLVLASRGFGQALYMPRYQEPRLFVFQLSQASVGAYGRAPLINLLSELGIQRVARAHIRGACRRVLLSTAPFTTQTFSPMRSMWMAPMAGLTTHSTQADSRARRETKRYLGTFGFSVDLLSGKPYHATVFVNRPYSAGQRFFTRVTVDREVRRPGWLAVGENGISAWIIIIEMKSPRAFFLFHHKIPLPSIKIRSVMMMCSRLWLAMSANEAAQASTTVGTNTPGRMRDGLGSAMISRYRLGITSDLGRSTAAD